MWIRKASQVIKHFKTNTRDGSIALDEILHQLLKAEEKHPCFPYDDPVHMVAILVEEAGESMQAALDFTYSDGTIKDLRKELAQTGAMAIRALMHLPVNYEKEKL